MKQLGCLEIILRSLEFDTCICTRDFHPDLEKQEHFSFALLSFMPNLTLKGGLAFRGRQNSYTWALDELSCTFWTDYALVSLISLMSFFISQYLVMNSGCLIIYRLSCQFYLKYLV